MFLRLDKNRLADGNTQIFFPLFKSLLTKIQPGNMRSGTVSFKMFNFIHLFSVNVSLTSNTVGPICLCDISNGISL